MANEIKWSKTGLVGGGGSDLDGIDGATVTAGDYAFVGINGLMHLFKANGASSAAANSPFNIPPATNPGTVRWELQQTFPFGANVHNLKPVVNAAVNKLDIFAKSSGLAPAGNNIIGVSIPDGNGNTFRTRGGAYLSGTSQIVMADAANYWSKGSLDGEIKTAWLYAAWDGTGIVWMLRGYSGFTTVSESTTATDDDFCLLEESSTYTKHDGDYCVAICKIRYQYDTADTPDHTIQASGENAPGVIWNPRSDYEKTVSAAEVTAVSDIPDDSYANMIVKQSGKYIVFHQVNAYAQAADGACQTKIKTGSSTYASAVQKQVGYHLYGARVDISIQWTGYLNAGDSVHWGVELSAGSATRTINGTLSIQRTD